MATHDKDIIYDGGYAKLAEDIGNLRYDSLGNFLKLLANKINGDADKDKSNGRRRLANELYAAASHIDNAWTISAPYMRE